MTSQHRFGWFWVSEGTRIYVIYRNYLKLNSTLFTPGVINIFSSTQIYLWTLYRKKFIFATILCSCDIKRHCLETLHNDICTGFQIDNCFFIMVDFLYDGINVEEWRRRHKHRFSLSDKSLHLTFDITRLFCNFRLGQRKNRRRHRN